MELIFARVALMLINLPLSFNFILNEGCTTKSCIALKEEHALGKITIIY